MKGMKYRSLLEGFDRTSSLINYLSLYPKTKMFLSSRLKKLSFLFRKNRKKKKTNSSTNDHMKMTSSRYSTANDDPISNEERKIIKYLRQLMLLHSPRKKHWISLQKARNNLTYSIDKYLYCRILILKNIYCS